MMLTAVNAVLVGVCLLGTMTAANKWRETKDDILALNGLVYTATRSAKEIYPRRFCKQLITNESYLRRIHTPPVIQPSTVNTHDENARDKFMVDMAVTISKYHHLVSRVMKYEKAYLCHPAIGKRKCVYPKICKAVKNKGFDIFYCNLYYVAGFLKSYNYYLKGLMPYDAVPKPHMNDLASVKVSLPQSLRRCYTLAILNTILEQSKAFQKVMSTF